MAKNSRKSVGQNYTNVQREVVSPFRLHGVARWLTDPISGLIHGDVVKDITILQMYSCQT